MTFGVKEHALAIHKDEQGGYQGRCRCGWESTRNIPITNVSQQYRQHRDVVEGGDGFAKSK